MQVEWSGQDGQYGVDELAGDEGHQLLTPGVELPDDHPHQAFAPAHVPEAGLVGSRLYLLAREHLHLDVVEYLPHKVRQQRHQACRGEAGRGIPQGVKTLQAFGAICVPRLRSSRRDLNRTKRTKTVNGVYQRRV